MVWSILAVKKLKKSWTSDETYFWPEVIMPANSWILKENFTIYNNFQRKML